MFESAAAAAAAAAESKDTLDRQAAVSPPDVFLRAREFELDFLSRALKQVHHLLATDAKSSYNRDVARTSGGGDRHVILMQQLEELEIDPEKMSFNDLFATLSIRCVGREWSDEMLALKKQWEEYLSALYQTNYKWMSKNGDVGAGGVFNAAVAKLRFSTLTTNDLYKYGQCRDRVQSLDVLIPESLRVCTAATENARRESARKRKAVSEETQGVMDRTQQAAAAADWPAVVRVVDRRLRLHNRTIGAAALQAFNSECVAQALRLCEGHRERAVATVKLGHSDRGNSSLSLVDAVKELCVRIDANSAAWKQLLAMTEEKPAVLWRDVFDFVTAIRRNVSHTRLQERSFAVGAGSVYQKDVFSHECIGVTQRASKAVSWCAYSCHGELAAIESWSKPFDETAQFLQQQQQLRAAQADSKEPPLKRARLESKEQQSTTTTAAATTTTTTEENPLAATVMRLKELVVEHSAKADACEQLLSRSSESMHKMREAVYGSALSLDYAAYLEQMADLVDGLVKEANADPSSDGGLVVPEAALAGLRLLFETTEQRHARGLGAAPPHPSIEACIKSDAEMHDQARRTTASIGDVCLADIAEIGSRLALLRSYYSNVCSSAAVQGIAMPAIGAVYPEWLYSMRIDTSRDFVGLQKLASLVLAHWTAFTRGSSRPAALQRLVGECIRQAKASESAVAAVAHAASDTSSAVASINSIESSIGLFDCMFHLVLVVRLMTA